ncbi:LytR family transcriptional regulator, partial [Candidatus Uhrbacteria bacterium]|nr:LytR family transcriptional regulator [Candidatus Uhrbacteria bacterium]
HRNEDPLSHRRTFVLAGIFVLIVAGISAIGASASYRAVNHGTSVLTEIGQLPVLRDLRGMFGATNDDHLLNTPDHRLNILLLGVGGEGHDGPQLTDTILLASLDLQTKKIALLSIPRDLAYPLGGGRFEKINSVNAYAEQEHPGEGSKYTAEALSKLLEVRIDHVLRVDFRGFEDFINALGGIDLRVEKSFVDPAYPVSDVTPEVMTISFKQGSQHMNGKTTLTFVRSRHGSNNEGSDFARSRRQQLVLLAVREKLLSLGTLTDPSKISALYTAISTHIQSDLTPWQVLTFAPLIPSFSPQAISLKVLTDDPNHGELTAANVDGSYMLFPKKPDWSDIRTLAQNPFTTNDEQIKEDHLAEPIKLEIKNGTTRTGFAAQVAAKLEKDGYEISSFGNALDRANERTMIYDLTQGKKSIELARLRKLLNADVSITSPSQTSSTRIIYTNHRTAERILSPNADFLVILGEASYGLLSN